MPKSKHVRRKRALPSRLPVPGQTSGSIWQACARSGIGRTKMYELGGLHKDLMVKCGGKTIVIFSVLDRIIAEFPPASISAT